MDSAMLLDREMYGIGQAAALLGLPRLTVRGWLNGYRRGGESYPPVIRAVPTDSETVTWGEFVELAYLREYRRANVPLQRIRPVIDRLRDELNTPYPLAQQRPLVYDHELVLRIQEETQLDRALAIVVRTGQQLMVSSPVGAYLQKVEFDNDVVARWRPAGKTSPVVVDPNFSFGRPSIRGVATERIAELYRAGDTTDFLAEIYELPLNDINSAIAYETQMAAMAA